MANDADVEALVAAMRSALTMDDLQPTEEELQDAASRALAWAKRAYGGREARLRVALQSLWYQCPQGFPPYNHCFIAESLALTPSAAAEAVQGLVRSAREAADALAAVAEWVRTNPQVQPDFLDAVAAPGVLDGTVRALRDALRMFSPGG
jgi:hypothetical protein